MTRLPRAILPAVALALFLMAACGSLPPAQHIYLLTPPAEPAAPIAASSGQNEIELMPVTIPDYLDTTDIMLRSGASELTASPTGRWGERLSAGLARSLAADLQSRLPTTLVTLTAPFDKKLRRATVDVEAFDIWPDGHCVLTARWTILDADGQTVLISARASFVTPAQTAGGVAGDAAIVASVSSAVGQLADQIAAAAAR
jgi:uncharacterized lipoprotein YmbA